MVRSEPAGQARRASTAALLGAAGFQRTPPELDLGAQRARSEPNKGLTTELR